MPHAIHAQQGSHKLHRHWPPDFADSVNCFIADKPKCNINYWWDCVYVPYLNTTQNSAKSERQMFDGFFRNFCSE